MVQAYAVAHERLSSRWPLGANHGEESAVLVKNNARDAQVFGISQTILPRAPGLAIVGGFKEALFEDTGVEGARIFGTSRINHDRSDGFERDSRGDGLPGGAEIEREANAARAI